MKLREVCKRILIGKIIARIAICADESNLAFCIYMNDFSSYITLWRNHLKKASWIIFYLIKKGHNKCYTLLYQIRHKNKTITFLLFQKETV